MKAFDYVQANQPADALRLISAAPATRFIAGGTNLVDLMKYGIESPDTLVDISRLPLAQIQANQTGLRIGALARNSDVAANALVQKQFPLLSEALLAGASPQLRNQATMGGNLLQRTRCYYFYDPSQPCNKRAPGSGCGAIGGQNRIHAILGANEGAGRDKQCIATNPSDMNVALSALGAVVQLSGPAGTRSVPLIDFHRLPGDAPQRDTVLEPNELITAIDLPTPKLTGKSHYLKVRDRASYAFALVSVATRMAVENGIIRDVRIALGGVAHKPWRMPEVEQQLIGKRADEATFRAAAQQLLAGAKPHEHNAFKIRLAENSIVRALTMVSS
ncbi:xanthine dehydrogenase YagS FAD-binding subunit [Fibrella aestuarina BUZ 2]|uniref:Xanthine dehydrogenase YagS FAD-binding subunit n=1 Tax=Fibrella aestuarina BUZ 2 TaxID=1166018 RepID=I0K1W7_9BACT|nr:xanthine dehydrogenase family protein subunit M [Fibrella aestuarina]CCG98120.1 xanthine dehydrogenase YagS FAD-binding subunit [Fibrella aestuarina BUZ 2]